jgi:nucleotide-binding universal stress UspA family protein
MKTLLATDGSTYATTALLTAGRLLAHRNNRFVVTCIIPELAALRAPYRDQIQRKTDDILKNAKQMLKAAGADASTFSQTGSPADVLVKLAADYDAIVVGAQSGAERASPGLGPVASRVVEHSSGIVLVGRPLVNENNFRILVGVDGSTSSENALELLSTSFQLSEADVTLIHVVEKPWLRLGLDQGWYDEFERSYAETSEEPANERVFETELRSEAQQIVERARARLRDRCLGIEARIMDGNPANEILEQAEIGDYDLVVIGATGASDLKHTMLGSVSFKLASYAPCSVAVIR